MCRFKCRTDRGLLKAGKVTLKKSNRQLAKTSNIKYKFGSNFGRGIGIMTVWIPVSKSYATEINAEVVNVAVPLLVCLDVLTRLRIVLDFDQDTKVSNQHRWSMPLSRKMVIVTWSCLHPYNLQKGSCTESMVTFDAPHQKICTS